MKKDLLIKKIASEFNVDEILVSEYFDSIFGTLAAAFIKNKNVNISEFGKFKVKTKKDEEGEKQKTVLFSPVKKFADDVNYNFSELMPVQIRLMDSGTLASGAGEDYDEEFAEEVLLIDFDEEYVSEEKAKVLIPKESKSEIQHEETEKEKEEVLIPESETHETPTLESEKKKEVLIPEPGTQETPTLETEKMKEVLIHEAPVEEIYSESIPFEIKETAKKEKEKTKDYEPVKFDEDISRILEELDKIIFPEKIFIYLPVEIKHKEILSAAKTITQDATIYIKQEKTKEIKTEEDEIDYEIEKLKALFAGEKEHEIPTEHETEKLEEIKIPESAEDIVNEEPQNVFIEKTKEERQEEIIPELTPDVSEIKEDESPKSSLDLEAELLQMLDERKKILDEIRKLENTDTDDIVDISGPKTNGDDEKPKLHDESTLDHPKQNIFVDDEGKILEDLLNLISGEETTKEEPPKEEEIVSEQTEEILPEIKEGFKEEEDKEETEDEIKEELKPEAELKSDLEYTEKPGDITPAPVGELDNLESLLGNLYEKPEEEILPPEPLETEPQLNNLEMQVFDKLLDETEKPSVEQPEPVMPETTTEQDKELTSFSDLEKMFRSFKTEITDPEPIAEKPAEEKPQEEIPVTTETIKTYDDISNLMEPNGGKKEEKPAAPPPEPPKKKMTPGIRLAIIFGIVVVIILFFVFFYERLVYKPSESPKQLPVTQPVDSTRTAGSDSVVYADTNKTKEQENSEIVFEKDDKIIKETPKGFYIEFGEFENQFVLAKEIKVLKDKGVTPGYEEIKSEGKTYYKMKLGPYKSLKEAKSILPKL
jgi:nucleoid DNA-binding protein